MKPVKFSGFDDKRGAVVAPYTFRESGVMIRPIGLEFRESSPDSVVWKVCPDRIPEIRRVVVPLFMVFNVEEGSFNP